MELELNKAMFRALSLEASKNQETMNQQEQYPNEFTIVSVPEHEILPSDMKEDIIGFTVPLNLT
jgi:hypothetical protein